MRRLIILMAATTALAIALIVGPLGAAAAGPYVSGCGSLQIHWFGATGGGPNHETVQLDIYNGSASSATLTHKILAGDGTILNAGQTPPVPLTTTLAATKSEQFAWDGAAGNVNTSNNNIPASIRVVSDVPVAVGVLVNGTLRVDCIDLRP
jgi:hypothetical protein